MTAHINNLLLLRIDNISTGNDQLHWKIAVKPFSRPKRYHNRKHSVCNNKFNNDKEIESLKK